MEDLKVNVTVEGNEVIVRHGNAPDVVVSQKVLITGEIDAPALFIANQPADKAKAVVLVDEDKGTIVYLEDPSYPKAASVTGRLVPNPGLDKFAINTERSWEPEDLAQVLKMNRVLFPNQTALGETVAALKNIQAKIDSEYSAANDNRGNIENKVKQVVASNVPREILFEAKLFVGQKPVAFKVELFITTKNQRIFINLDSADMKEQMDRQKAELLVKGLEKLQEAGLTIIQTF